MRPSTVLYKDGHGSWISINFDPTYRIHVLHVEIKKWSLSKCKEYKVVLNELCKQLKDRGVSKVYSMCQDSKAKRFNEFFGFLYTNNKVWGENGIEYYLMEKDT